MKPCTKCLENESRAGHSWCTACLAKARRKYYYNNRRQEIAKSAAWAKAHPDKQKEYAKITYERQRDKWRAQQRLYRESNIATCMRAAARSRARKKKLSFSLTVEDIQRAIDNSNGICPVLGIPLEVAVGVHTANSLSLDRVNNNIGYEPGNICVVSHRANTIKGDASLEELKAMVSWMEKVS